MRNVVLLTWLVLTTSCATIPDIKACTVAGRLANGMDCTHSLQSKMFEMSLDETIRFLEPSAEENRAGAICMSSADFVAHKTALEQSCKLLGSRCKKAKIPEAVTRIDKLRVQSLNHLK